ncbi:MAG: hypothetical protein ACTSUP_00300, partial [Candidatus Heimdallarchaeaceae archaeon]
MEDVELKNNLRSKISEKLKEKIGEKLKNKISEKLKDKIAEKEDNKIFNAIFAQESDSNLNPEAGDNGFAVGPLQIHPDFLKDASDYSVSQGRNKWTLDDRHDYRKSKQIVRDYVYKWKDELRGKKDVEEILKLYHLGVTRYRNEDFDEDYHKEIMQKYESASTNPAVVYPETHDPNLLAAAVKVMGSDDKKLTHKKLVGFLENKIKELPDREFYPFMIAIQTDPFGLREFMLRHIGKHITKKLPDYIPAFYDAAQNVQEELKLTNPRKYAGIVGGIAKVSTEFGVLPGSVPTKFALQTALQTPSKGETAKGRIISTGISYITGHGVSILNKIPFIKMLPKAFVKKYPKAAKVVAKALGITTTTSSFMGLTAARGGDTEAVIQTGIEILGFEASGLLKLGYRKKALEAALKLHPELKNVELAALEKIVDEVNDAYRYQEVKTKASELGIKVRNEKGHFISKKQLITKIAQKTKGEKLGILGKKAADLLDTLNKEAKPIKDNIYKKLSIDELAKRSPVDEYALDELRVRAGKKRHIVERPDSPKGLKKPVSELSDKELKKRIRPGNVTKHRKVYIQELKWREQNAKVAKEDELVSKIQGLETTMSLETNALAKAKIQSELDQVNEEYYGIMKGKEKIEPEVNKLKDKALKIQEKITSKKEVGIRKDDLRNLSDEYNIGPIQLRKIAEQYTNREIPDDATLKHKGRMKNIINNMSPDEMDNVEAIIKKTNPSKNWSIGMRLKRRADYGLNDLESENKHFKKSQENDSRRSEGRWKKFVRKYRAKRQKGKVLPNIFSIFSASRTMFGKAEDLTEIPLTLPAYRITKASDAVSDMYSKMFAKVIGGKKENATLSDIEIKNLTKEVKKKIGNLTFENNETIKRWLSSSKEVRTIIENSGRMPDDLLTISKRLDYLAQEGIMARERMEESLRNWLKNGEKGKPSDVDSKYSKQQQELILKNAKTAQKNNQLQEYTNLLFDNNYKFGLIQTGYYMQVGDSKAGTLDYLDTQSAGPVETFASTTAQEPGTIGSRVKARKGKGRPKPGSVLLNFRNELIRTALRNRLDAPIKEFYDRVNLITNRDVEMPELSKSDKTVLEQFFNSILKRPEHMTWTQRQWAKVSKTFWTSKMSVI